MSFADPADPMSFADPKATVANTRHFPPVYQTPSRSFTNS
jgi:hypothetical protein